MSQYPVFFYQTGGIAAYSLKRHYHVCSAAHVQVSNLLSEVAGDASLDHRSAPGLRDLPPALGFPGHQERRRFSAV